MEAGKNTAISEWAARLRAASNALSAASKWAAKADVDPFAARRNLHAIVNKFKGVHLDEFLPPDETMSQLDAECTRQKAEFWGQLSAACEQRGWELYGTTARRLLNRAFFIEATDDKVAIETLPAMPTFHVPNVVKELEAATGTLNQSRQNLQQFMELVEIAFESLGGGERLVEDVYRQVVWHAQNAAFWRILDPQQFVRVTRPQFRSWLAQVLHDGLRTPSGREVRFGTTVQVKQAWEIYSPGECRVVQVGRVALS